MELRKTIGRPIEPSVDYIETNLLSDKDAEFKR